MQRLLEAVTEAAHCRQGLVGEEARLNLERAGERGPRALQPKGIVRPPRLVQIRLRQLYMGLMDITITKLS